MRYHRKVRLGIAPYAFALMLATVALALLAPSTALACAWDVWGDTQHGSACDPPSPGVFDTTFSDDGKQTIDFGTSGDVARAVAIQADGKIVDAGYSYFLSAYVFAVARYNSDGSLDTTFSGDGKETTDVGPASDYAFAVAIQTDGKIVLTGYTNDGTNGHDDFAVVRYNNDGSLDSSFSSDGKQTINFGSYDRARLEPFMLR